VSKLLTGFDAPRNTVLYIARHLKEHGLLQAIARVNRVLDEDGAQEKPFGYIIDYNGVLKDLGQALARRRRDFPGQPRRPHRYWNTSCRGN
jgi:type I restriction enzyme R subunit